MRPLHEKMEKFFESMKVCSCFLTNFFSLLISSCRKGSMELLSLLLLMINDVLMQKNPKKIPQKMMTLLSQYQKKQNNKKNIKSFMLFFFFPSSTLTPPLLHLDILALLSETFFLSFSCSRPAFFFMFSSSPCESNILLYLCWVWHEVTSSNFLQKTWGGDSRRGGDTTDSSSSWFFLFFLMQTFASVSWLVMVVVVGRGPS